MIGLVELVAGAGLIGVILYGVLAGADFGGGIWDLLAAGPRRTEQRRAIAHAMGPVWEANHVWLIFVIVVLFGCFPPAFAALSVGLFTVFHLVLVGITLRGAAFVFRGPEIADSGAGHWGAMFGVASVFTPFLLGTAVGAVSSGELRVIDGTVQVDGPAAWLAPVSLMIGAFALALCAYVAAVFLVIETQGELQQDFRRRALWAGTVVVVLTIAALPFLYLQAPHLWEGLTRWSVAPVVLAGVAAMLVSGWGLWKHHYRTARVATIAQVSFLLLGWGLAQYPYLIYPDVLLHESAAPAPTLKFVLYSLPIGGALLVPSLWFLFKVFKTTRLEGEKI